MASSDGRDWSDLPYDLLLLILNRIPDVRDCVRLRVTCKNYYSMEPSDGRNWSKHPYDLLLGILNCIPDVRDCVRLHVTCKNYYSVEPSDGRNWSKHPYDLLLLILNRIPDVRDCIRLRATCKNYYYMEPSDGRNWSKHPYDLLLLILNRIPDVRDCVRLHAACKNYCKNYYSMEPSDGRNWSKHPYDLLFGTLNRIPHVRDCARLHATYKYYYSPPNAHPIRDRKFLGSSNGWLVIADSSADLHIIDPRTGARVPLPPTSTLFNKEKVERDADGQITGYTTKRDSLFHSVGKFWDNYCWMVRILPSSSSSVTAFVAHGADRLYMAKPGDWSWTKIKCQGTVTDVLQHKGLFYAMSMYNSETVVALLDIVGCPPVVVRYFTDHVRYNREYYLAESCDGDDLVLVCKYTSRATGETVNFEAARLRLILSGDDGSGGSIHLERVGQGPGLFMLKRYDRMMFAPINNLLRDGSTENCIFFIDNDDVNSDVGIFRLKDRGGRQCFCATGSMGREDGKVFSDGRPPAWEPF